MVQKNRVKVYVGFVRDFPVGKILLESQKDLIGGLSTPQSGSRQEDSYVGGAEESYVWVRCAGGLGQEDSPGNIE